jgi:hypothetical protein
MATQTARTFSVVPGSGTENEVDKIKNTVEAPKILERAIDNFGKERAKAKDEFDKSLATEITTGLLNVDNAIESYKAWEATDEALKAKIKTAKALKPIIEKLIKELKASHSEALNSAILQLRKEATAEGEKVKLIQEQIARLETLSGEPRKSSATAKRKKG